MSSHFRLFICGNKRQKSSNISNNKSSAISPRLPLPACFTLQQVQAGRQVHRYYHLFQGHTCLALGTQAPGKLTITNSHGQELLNRKSVFSKIVPSSTVQLKFVRLIFKIYLGKARSPLLAIGKM